MRKKYCNNFLTLIFYCFVASLYPNVEDGSARYDSPGKFRTSSQLKSFSYHPKQRISDAQLLNDKNFGGTMQHQRAIKSTSINLRNDEFMDNTKNESLDHAALR